MFEIKFVVDNALLWSFPWHSLRTGSLSFCLCMPVEDTLCSLDRVSVLCEVTLTPEGCLFCHCVYMGFVPVSFPHGLSPISCHTPSEAQWALR